MSQRIKEIVESLSVSLVLIFVLLPVRVLFVRYVTDDWFGSFGLITLISVSILILARKNKLGWFGRAFHRQMFKINRGKRKYFVYTQLTLGILFFGATIYGIEVGADQYQDELEQMKEILKEDNIESFSDVQEEIISDFDWRQLPWAMVTLVYTIIARFDIFALIMTVMNDLADGYILHFSTVIFVEQIEVAGIVIFYKFSVKKQDLDT